MKLDRAAKGVFLMEFVTGFVLAMRYFFKPKATLNYPFEKGPLSPRFRSGAHTNDGARWIGAARFLAPREGLPP